MSEDKNEKTGKPFGFKHIGGGVIGLEMNFGGAESYIPLFMAVSPQENLDKSSKKAFDLLRLDFENESVVIDKIKLEIDRVMKHVRTKIAPLVKNYEGFEIEFDTLVHGSPRKDRSEKENKRIDEVIEEQYQKGMEIMETNSQLGMKSLSEAVSSSKQIALVLLVMNEEGRNKDRDGRNHVDFRLGLLAKDPESTDKFCLDSITIAEADVFSENIKPIIHSASSEVDKKDLGGKDIIPIIVFSSPNKLLEARLD